MVYRFRKLCGRTFTVMLTVGDMAGTYYIFVTYMVSYYDCCTNSDCLLQMPPTTSLTCCDSTNSTEADCQCRHSDNGGAMPRRQQTTPAPPLGTLRCLLSTASNSPFHLCNSWLAFWMLCLVL